MTKLDPNGPASAPLYRPYYGDRIRFAIVHGEAAAIFVDGKPITEVGPEAFVHGMEAVIDSLDRGLARWEAANPPPGHEAREARALKRMEAEGDRWAKAHGVNDQDIQRPKRKT